MTTFATLESQLFQIIDNTLSPNRGTTGVLGTFAHLFGRPTLTSNDFILIGNTPIGSDNNSGGMEET